MKEKGKGEGMGVRGLKRQGGANKFLAPKRGAY